MVRNKSNGKCRAKCLPGRIRNASGRCIKRPKKSTSSAGAASSGAVSTRGFAGSGMSLDDKIKSWHETGSFFATKSGYMPPPGVRSSALTPSSMDTPVWTSGEDDGSGVWFSPRM
jgi:hypothetical protein